MSGSKQRTFERDKSPGICLDFREHSRKFEKARKNLNFQKKNSFLKNNQEKHFKKSTKIVTILYLITLAPILTHQASPCDEFGWSLAPRYPPPLRFCLSFWKLIWAVWSPSDLRTHKIPPIFKKCSFQFSKCHFLRLPWGQRWLPDFQRLIDKIDFWARERSFLSFFCEK